MFKPQGWQRSTRLLAVSSVLLLSACGGGGGGSSSGGGSATYYTVTVSTTGNGSVSPSDPQSVASNGSVTFTATPDAGWRTSGISTSGASSCLSNSDFSTGTGTYTVANPRADCAFTVNFTQITHKVSAVVKSGLLPVASSDLSVMGSPDFSVVDSSNQYLWVVDGYGDHDENYDPSADKLSVYRIGADGDLTLQDSIAVPYVAADCASGTTANAQSNYCMVAGPENSNAAGYVYVRFNDDCSTTPCGAASIHRYHLVSGHIVDAGAWDIPVALTGASVSGTDMMAIDPAGSHFYVVSRQTISSGSNAGTYLTVAAYDINASGVLSAAGSSDPFAFNTSIHDAEAMTFFKRGSNLFAYIVLSGYGDLTTNPGVDVNFTGIVSFSVDSTGKLTGGNNTVWNVADGEFDALAFDSSNAYYAFSYPSSSDQAVSNVDISRATINTDGSLDIPNSSTVATLFGAKVDSLGVVDSANLLFASYKDVESGANGNWDTAHVATYSISANAPLSYLSTVDEAVNGDYYVQSMAVSANGSYAYLALPNQGIVKQYLIGTDNGSVTPATQDVNEGDGASVTVTSDVGYTAIVSGCGGALASGTYNTAAVTADCTVSASFVAN